MAKACILFRNTFVLFFWEVVKIFAAGKQMKNWHASAAVLWMFCPPGLRAGHVTEIWESVTVYLDHVCLDNQSHYSLDFEFLSERVALFADNRKEWEERKVNPTVAKL